MTLLGNALSIAFAAALLVGASPARADVVDKNLHAAEIVRACERNIAAFKATLDRNGMTLDGTAKPASSFAIPTCRSSAFGKELIASAQDPKRIAYIDQKVASLGRQGFIAEIERPMLEFFAKFDLRDISKIHPTKNWTDAELRAVLPMLENMSAAQALIAQLRKAK